MAKLVNSEREFDIVVLGATGVAGAYIAKYLAKRALKTSPHLKWAMAGRSENKMMDVLSEITREEDEKREKEEIELIVCDVSNVESLAPMISRTKLVINCTGPYRFLGENVVKLCAEKGTHYIDICGEPEFMEKCAFKYFNTAQESGSIIVSACGFDSIPSDMGQEFVNQWFVRQKGICSGVECYVLQDMAKGYTVNKTTLEAALYGFAASKDLNKLRKELEKVEWRHSRNAINRSGPVQKVQKQLWFWAKPVEKYAILFPFADSAVVANSQGIRSALLHHQGLTSKTFPQFSCYLCFANGWELSTTLATGAMMKTIGQFNWGRKLMLNYPWWTTFGTFSSDGPTQEQIEASTFTSEFFAEGYSESILNKYKNDPLEIPKTITCDLRVHAKVHGPDSGYHGTALMCVESAICLLEEEQIIRRGNVNQGYPQIKGGVFTPSTIFCASSLIDRLNESGIKFTLNVLSDDDDEDPEMVEFDNDDIDNDIGNNVEVNEVGYQDRNNGDDNDLKEWEEDDFADTHPSANNEKKD